MASACKEAPGSSTCTTLSGGAVKMEIYPVKANDVFKQDDFINIIKNPVGVVIYADKEVAENTTAVFEITQYVPAALNLKDDDEIVQWSITSLGGNAKFFEGKTKGRRVRIYGTMPGEIRIDADYGWINKASFRANVVNLRKLKFRVSRIKCGASEPTFGMDQIRKHVRMANFYLRQIGVKLVPDDSTEVATSTGNAKIGDPGVLGAPAVPATPTTPASLAVAAVPGTDAKVVTVKLVDPGFFEVEVNDPNMTVTAGVVPDMINAIRVNAKNEIINLAYVHSINSPPVPATTLGIALLRPVNHGGPAVNPPAAAVVAGTQTFVEKATPSTSWIAPNGLPAGSIPSPPPTRDGPGGDPTGAEAPVTMTLMGPNPKEYQSASPATRDRNLLWGLVMDGQTSPVQDVGNTMAHEVGHVLGLRHRQGAGPDGLPWPPNENLMNGTAPSPQAEDLDVIQCKAIRFCELFSRAGSMSNTAEYEPLPPTAPPTSGGMSSALEGALIGALVGALVGGLIGFIVSGGNPLGALAGAAIGAAVGAGLGAALGSLL
jgi:hypothetical protein